MSALRFDYHDACLVSASVGPRREASFRFDLSPVLYPGGPGVTLRLGGLFAFDAVARFVAALHAEPARVEGAYLARCNALGLDPSGLSKDGDISVVLDLELSSGETSAEGRIRLRCRHVSERAS